MILQPVSGLVFELQKHQASCEAVLGPFLDGQLSGIAQLSLTAVFWETCAPARGNTKKRFQYSILLWHTITSIIFRWKSTVKVQISSLSIFFEILLFFLRFSQSGFGQDYDIGKFCLKQGFGSALIYCGSGYGSGSSIFSNCGSGFRIPDPDSGSGSKVWWHKIEKNLQAEI